jgi:hypothetical protein
LIAAVPFAIFCLVLMILCALLLCAGGVRLHRTPRGHLERAVRRDTVRLLALVTVSMGLATARTQFLSTSLPFLVLSAALILLGVVAVWLMGGLTRAYRRDKTQTPDPVLPDIETLQSRITPPPDRRNQ